MTTPCLKRTECPHLKNSKKLFTSSKFDDDYTFLKCAECGIIYHDPEMSQDVLDEFFTGYGNYSDRDYFKTQISLRKNLYLTLAEALKTHLPNVDSPRVLEIGCSNGILLHWFKHYGYECYGLDVDEYSTSLARELIGDGRIFTGQLNDSPFINEKFDVIILDQTIEHLPNPFEVLKQASLMQNQGGVLSISTPNFDGFSFKLLRDRWKNVMPSDHISMFTPDSIDKFIAPLNYKIVYKKMIGSSFDARRENHREFKKYNGKLSSIFMKKLSKYLTRKNLGDNIVVTCIKNE